MFEGCKSPAIPVAAASVSWSFVNEAFRSLLTIRLTADFEAVPTPVTADFTAWGLICSVAMPACTLASSATAMTPELLVKSLKTAQQWSCLSCDMRLEADSFCRQGKAQTMLGHIATSPSINASRSRLLYPWLLLIAKYLRFTNQRSFSQKSVSTVSSVRPTM